MADLLSILQNVTGWLSDNEALYLNQAAARVQPPNVIVEIGSFQGKSTIALALNSSVPVYAIDPHHAHTDEIGGVFGPADRAKFHENIVAAGVHERVCPINLPSSDVWQAWERAFGLRFGYWIGLLFVDGAHNFEQIKNDALRWQQFVAPGGLICVHDKTWGDVVSVLQIMDSQTELIRLSDCDSIAVYEVMGE